MGYSTKQFRNSPYPGKLLLSGERDRQHINEDVIGAFSALDGKVSSMEITWREREEAIWGIRPDPLLYKEAKKKSQNVMTTGKRCLHLFSVNMSNL